MKFAIPENLKPPHKRAGAATQPGTRAARPPTKRRSKLPSGREAVSSEELAKRRDELAAQFVEMQWDLGGLTYEMARRDHFRLDVLVRRAAKLQEVDAALSEAERMLRLEDAGAGGTCRSCGALHARGAVFCWQCGQPLMEQVAPAAVRPPAQAPQQAVAAQVEAVAGPREDPSRESPTTVRDPIG